MMFVPIGLLAEQHALPLAIGASLSVELLQLVTRKGMFDIDDIISNILGTIVGVVGLWALQESLSQIRKHIDGGKMTKKRSAEKGKK